MARLSGAWLTGTAGLPVTQDWPGQRLGRPENGPGAVASFGARIGALATDFVLSWLVATLIAHSADTGPYWSTVVYAAQALVFMSLFGQTPGMRLLGLRLERPHGGRVFPGWVAVRLFLLLLIVPPLIWDRDGRGLHDKAANTLVART
jgi:uncharacterized RDD family membrane protein YckC